MDTKRFDGTSNNDVLLGSAGSDVLYGYAGSDSINGGAGGDTMVGGTGDDYYYSDSSLDVILESANEGTDTMRVTYSASLANHVENLVLLPGGMELDGVGNSLNNVMMGNSAANVLSGFGGNDTLYGYEGDDALGGGEGNDSLIGGEGSDQLIGGEGVNTLYGGIGDDYYVGTIGGQDVIIENANEGLDTVITFSSMTLVNHVENMVFGNSSSALSGTGNALNNEIDGNSYNNRILGMDGDDLLSGEGGNDSLEGGNGADTLIGGAGVNKLTGGTGNDHYVVSVAKDAVVEASNGGVDTVSSSLTWVLGSNVENLVLQGSTGIAGTGNTLANGITGNSAANKLSGSSGNDTLNGAGGIDTLTGGTGSDIFVIDSSVYGAADRVTDFSVKDDTFRIEMAIFPALGNVRGVLNANYFKSSTTGAALDANDYIGYATKTGQIFYDSDGNGVNAPILIATVAANLKLTAADFDLI